VLAQEEARALSHNYIGTEHILLGLLREEEGIAARVLGELGVTLEEIRSQVAQIVGRGDEVSSGQIPFTPRAIGTEHILLGLARENEGVAARILLDLGVTAERIAESVLRLLGGEPVPQTGRRRRELAAAAVGAALFAVALGIGILIGWAIWAT